MNFMVEAGAIILGAVVFRPRVGEKGALVYDQYEVERDSS
jgi:hypothetical protein